MLDYLLELKGITKKFLGVVALDNVDFKLKPGSIHSLMGENGAGKSTLMKCLFGIYNADSGSIIFQGKEVKFKNTKMALLNGVAMVQQELNQATKRSVMDNMWLGRYPKKYGFIDSKKMYLDTKEIFNRLGININPKVILNKLSVSQRQMIEIAKAVSYDAKVIVFDEPTSSLTDTEIDKLFDIIRKLKANGCGIIYISHKMEEIFQISDEVTVMRDGKLISSNKVDEINIDIVIKNMVGRKLDNRYPLKTNIVGDKLLQVSNLSTSYGIKLENIEFSLKEGEILGIAGLVGSGRSELLEAIFGLRNIQSGNIVYKGKTIRNKNSSQAIKKGFALLTEERRQTGIFPILNVMENSCCANYKKYKSYGLINYKKMKEDARWVVNNLSVKTPGLRQKIKFLSGGNQQKVILGRWLLTNPNILMVDEPTRGIDVGAKYEIYQLLNELACDKKGILMVSSEMPELIGVCDRIMVMSNGRVAGILDKEQFSSENIMYLCAKYNMR